MALWNKRSDNAVRATPQSQTDPRRQGAMTGLERARHERQATPEPAPVFRSKPMAAPLPASPPATPAPSAAENAPTPGSAPVARPPRAEAAPVPPVPAASDSRAQLFAGAGVKVKGEISGCDSFRVEGDVDGQVSARHIVVAQNGVFKGTAHVEEAEIEGTVEGTLNVAGHLFLRSTGKLQGNVSYGQIEIERGGEVAGDINPHGGKSTNAAPARRPASVVPIEAGARKSADR